MLTHKPRFDLAFAERIGRERYGVDVRATALDSERDQNFMLETRAGEKLVLKIANALEAAALLEAQQAAMSHLAPVFALAPHVILTRDGTHFSYVRGDDGAEHLAWAVTCMRGVTLSDVRRRSSGLLEDFGRRTGELAQALSTFDHPATHRAFHWDLVQSRAVVAETIAFVRDEATRAHIEALAAQFDVYTAPLLPSLRRSVIHGDLNDHNVLAGGGDDLYSRHQHVTGFIDFGDIVHSYTVGDLAIAAAYMCLDADDPLPVIASMTRGYNHVSPLADDEVAALYGLLVMRLATSACLAAKQIAEQPDNAYLSVSQDGIRRALPLLGRIPFALATAVLRDACQREPVPASRRVRDWCASNTGNFAPVIDADLRTEPCTVLDLSVGSALIHGDSALNAEPRLTPRIAGVLRQAGHRIAIGRYDEPRLINSNAAFVTGTAYDAERRTVHMGLDVYAEAGTPVFAPLAGTVFALADNARPQDYGPVVMLRHVTDDGVAFFTLYGHLSRSSLSALLVGQAIGRGERFATLGDADENGGWTPHLHLQLFTDELGLGTELPGIVPASQRAVWRSISPDPNLIVGIPAVCSPSDDLTIAESVARRRQITAGNLSIAYRTPVRTVRGWMQYLYDDTGCRYVDAYNNVPHVGHCHPRVVEAAVGQMSVLNTNTRYLNDTFAEYAERLTATMPEPLRVCMLVSSASEANELALRMARAYTGAKHMIVLDAAYHGNTTSLIDLSPYKHAGPGGAGAPDWVHVARLPDDYRGPFKRDDAGAGIKYAREVEALIEGLGESNDDLCGFIAETCPSVGGQLMLPAGYLDGVYRHVRRAGGVCIADEVQTGLGRMGTHFWAFEAHGVVPDIVVLGKPLGNGHPVAAVVTTRAIADAFDNGMEYFSTFGGNNVSCAVGLAVLDVLRDESLQQHALTVGEQLLSGFRALAQRFDIIGDVRGSGLFLGLELVHDRETREPHGEAASFLSNRMRDRGILLGTDGPFHNVVKIRPPMPFSGGDADRLVSTFERILLDDFASREILSS